MALASLTATYSDSEGEEDERSETPEMDVQVEIPEQADAIKEDDTTKTTKIESSEELTKTEFPDGPAIRESTEEPSSTESSEERTKTESFEEPTKIDSPVEHSQIERPGEPEEINKLESPKHETKKRKLSCSEDLGPILGPPTKPEESWSYKGLLDFSKTKSSTSSPPPPEEETSPVEVDPSCYSYEGSVCIYTDPNTGAKYAWDDDTSEWKSREEDKSGEEDVSKNYVYDDTSEWKPREEDKSGEEDVSKNYVYDGNTYWYKDKAGRKYRWNNASNQWESVMQNCPIPEPENSAVMGPSNCPEGYIEPSNDGAEEPVMPSRAAGPIGPTLPEERPKLNDAAAYANLLVDTAPAIRSKVSGDRAARQLNHYMDYEAFERQANIGFEKPKFTKKQIQVLRRRKQEKKYKKSLEWLKKDY